MNFKRGQEVKTALGLGVPAYRIYRMQEFRGRWPDDEAGFFILDPETTMERLEQLADGELDRPDFLMEFQMGGDTYNGYPSVMLYEMHTCFIEYHAHKYLIESHIE